MVAPCNHSVSVYNNFDVSGISPSRFHHDLENEDPGDSLRGGGSAVHTRTPPINVGPQSNQGGNVELGILELLNVRESFDIRQIEAEKLFNDQNYQKAFDLIKSIADEDFYFLKVVPLYCSILIELGKVGELYYLAHKLVSANPDLAVSWFLVGSYYYLIKKYDLARKYYNKANRLDKHFAASWIAFGHSFAA